MTSAELDTSIEEARILGAPESLLDRLLRERARRIRRNLRRRFPVTP